MAFAGARWRTVADWSAQGYCGLRILRCADCGASTFRRWSDLDVGPDKRVFDVARELRCHACGRAPAGMAMLTRRKAE